MKTSKVLINMALFQAFAAGMMLMALIKSIVDGNGVFIAINSLFLVINLLGAISNGYEVRDRVESGK
jgi:hypothetical protein